jgi:hypothetical protein
MDGGAVVCEPAEGGDDKGVPETSPALGSTTDGWLMVLSITLVLNIAVVGVASAAASAEGMSDT